MKQFCICLMLLFCFTLLYPVDQILIDYVAWKMTKDVLTLAQITKSQRLATVLYGIVCTLREVVLKVARVHCT
jgi:hypothetical protein